MAADAEAENHTGGEESPELEGEVGALESAINDAEMTLADERYWFNLWRTRRTDDEREYLERFIEEQQTEVIIKRTLLENAQNLMRIWKPNCETLRVECEHSQPRKEFHHHEDFCFLN